ncbi:hypothetical protein F8388_005236 [Cannabis sativa]|uniref:Uncharacterized protein n=1 Tax=Cannabis sativa TaxID=3483 RepID=A0A7J6EL00_CANSA|nr:hypothetical protein F8388_005236 [Cannabis sativa]
MVCSNGGFPQLESLHIDSLSYLRELKMEEGALSSLCFFGIKSSGFDSVPDGLRYITTLKEIKIEDYCIIKFEVLAKFFSCVGFGQSQHTALQVSIALLKSFIQVGSRGVHCAMKLLWPFLEIVDSLGLLKDPFIRNWVNGLGGVKSNVQQEEVYEVKLMKITKLRSSTLTPPMVIHNTINQPHDHIAYTEAHHLC